MSSDPPTPPSTSSPPPVRPAATIVLARPARSETGDSFEVLLVKRHGKSGFMAGAHVFPGGRVDEGDAAHAEVLGARCASMLDGMERTAATGFCVAAIRETEEEAGIVLKKGGLPDVGALKPWSWWITPEAEPKRFDTRFFLASVPRGTVAKIDEHEAVDHAWLTPQGALEAYARGEILLAPPTLCTLEDLAAFTSIDDAALSVRRPMKPICPRLYMPGDSGVETMVLALPGDPLHDVKDPVFLGRTRIVMTDAGRFASATAPARRPS